MPLVFNVERVQTDDGRVKWRRVPTYAIVGWTLRESTADRLVYRPGWKPFAWRAAFAVVCVLVAIGLNAAANRETRPQGPTAEELAKVESIKRDTEQMKRDMRDAIGEERWARIEKDVEAKRVEDEKKRVETLNQLAKDRRWMRTFCQTLAVAFLFFGIITPLSAVWNRTTVQLLRDGTLQVDSWTLFPKRRTWQAAGFNHMLIEAAESGNRRSYLGYRWTVRLQNADEQTVLDVQPLAFVPHEQFRRPGERDPMPTSVQTLVDWLHARLNVEQVGPLIRDRRRWPL